MHLARLPVLLLVAALAFPAPAARAQSVLSDAFAATNAGLSPEEAAGREIWMFATAFNDRFFTYSYPQRIGGAIDWYEFLRADRRGDLFDAWGAIPDPDCCAPGDPDCPARSPTETYGLLWCPGDDELLAFVGREGYVDPACGFADAPFDASTPHGAVDQRQSACDLRFGTSTGALGFRKFPNPRFDAAAWERIGGWEGYAAFLSDDPADPDSRLNRLWDGSVEPPVRIGMACGACHIAYDPLNPPADPDHPALGEHRRAGRQPVQPGVEPARQRAVAAPARVAADRAGAAGDRRHLGAADGLRVEPGNDERDHQLRPAPDLRGAGAEVAQGLGLRARRRPARVLVRAGQARQVLAAERDGRAGAAHPEGRRGFDRLRGGDPAGLLQHRLLRRAVLGQPPDRPARRRPRPAQLRADAVRHRPVPARLRLVPGDRGPARRSPRLLPDGAADRPLAGAGPRLARGARGDARRRVFPRRGGARARGLRGELRALPFEPAGAVRDRRLPGDRPGRPDAQARLARQRRGGAGLGDRHLRGAVAAREPHGGAGLGRVCLARRPCAAGRSGAAGGDEGGRARLLSQRLAAERLGACAVHAQQRDRAGDLRRAGGRGGRLLLVALRRRRGGAARRRAGLPGVRSERRGAVRALRGVDGGAAEPGQAGAEGVRARRGHRRSTSRRRWRCSGATSG